ncbi:NAD(P)-dependent oxidoreductase [Nodosilinea nodulosa]|uniref:NAD(P)-dependent oxidoreductase n=1 Tax=Nodosilinea nodulosa TaxID=416001 RepID=UPI0002F1F829|nr:SDR family oxidoreductase [Nodosilinea nodulosa]
MKLLIFGATGSIGRQVVAQALEQGHSVTAFVRSPAKLEVQHLDLRIVQGDVLDLPSVQQAVQGQDAVVCVLGSGQNLTSTVRSQGTRNIVRAMEAAGVRRLICQSTLGAGDSWGTLNFYWKYIMFGLVLRRVFADHQRQEDAVKSSPLDWTIVRPGAFTDGPRTGQYRHGFAGNDTTSQLKISRADVADFIVKQLGNDAYLHQTPGLSY